MRPKRGTQHTDSTRRGVLRNKKFSQMLQCNMIEHKDLSLIYCIQYIRTFFFGLVYSQLLKYCTSKLLGLLYRLLPWYKKALILPGCEGSI